MSTQPPPPTLEKSNHLRRPGTRKGYCGLGIGTRMIDIDENLAFACPNCLFSFRTSQDRPASPPRINIFKRKKTR